jgi:isocitrate dehydrogenase (NAD+)
MVEFIPYALHMLFAPSSIYFQVTLIPGDGIGQEITDSVKEIFEHVNAPIEWEQYDVSGMSSSGEALFKQAMESLKRNRVGLKGFIVFRQVST